MPELKLYKVSNCPLCQINLSREITEIIFFRKLSDDVIMHGIENRLGIFITDKDYEQHRQYHIGYEDNEEESKEEISEIKEIDARIKVLKKKLKAMEAKSEVYSMGYIHMNKSLTELIKLRNEIKEGIKINVEGKISIREWVQKVLGEKDVEK